ncbi:hypothetical protein MY11210_001672 [Beauveria gryllotalpidicola]
MHFSAPLVLVTAITGDVKANVDGLDTAVKGWTSDRAPVLDASNKLVATIDQGTSTVQGNADLTLNEALSLLSQVKDLNAHAQILVDDSKGKKDGFQQAGLCGVISSQITSITDKSKGLVDTTVSKVPPATQNITKEQAQGFLDVLASVQTTFSTDNCKNA